MKEVNLVPKQLNPEDIVRHSNMLSQLDVLYDGVKFSAALSVLTAILSFCDENEDEIAGGNAYFENFVEEVFELTYREKRDFMKVMAECVDLNHKGILVLYDMGGGGVSYGFSKEAFNKALKSVSVH